MHKTFLFGMGGMHEIGKSTLVIEDHKDIVIVDAGIKFMDSFVTGIKGLIPDYTYLKKNQHKIKGIFVTHGHEDHIGGIPYLVKQVKIPKIFAPEIAIEYLKLKFVEHKIVFQGKFIKIKKNLVAKFTSIKVDVWTAQHSIPDAFGIRITTPNGKIMATGDFRFDYTPIGNLTDFSKLKQIGHEKLTLMLSDSTNAMRPFHSPSEKDILKDIEKYMKIATGKIIITAFASNLTRIKAIIELSEKLHKKVVTFGRSMVNGVEIGKKLNYIQVHDATLIDKKNVHQYSDDEIVVLTTGSQGEELAALSKMAQKKHHQIKIKQDDLIIFSSSPIPGNRMKVEELINKLIKLGAIVKENGIDGYLHTSGHAYYEEHFKIFQLTKPKYFLPYHGEYRMCLFHGKTAVDAGVKPKNILIPNNGQVIEIFQEKVSFSDQKIDVGPVFIEGNEAAKINLQTFKEREKLSQNGFFFVTIAFNEAKNKIIGKLRIMSRGLFYIKNSKEIIEEAKKLVHRATVYLIKNNSKWTFNELKNMISERLEVYFYKIRKRKPVVICSFLVQNKNFNGKSLLSKPK